MSRASRFAGRQVQRFPTLKRIRFPAGAVAIAGAAIGIALPLPFGGATAQTAPVARSEAGAGMVCVGTRGYGVACLRNATWVRWTRKGAQLASDFIYTIAACHGRILVSAGRRLHEFDARGRRAMRWTPGGHARRIACDPGGGYWITGDRTLAKWTGRKWRVYQTDAVLKAARAGWIDSFSVDRSGNLWVVAGGRVAARLDGSRDWKLFTAADGLPARWRLTGVHADRAGRVWLAHDFGLALRKGGGWKDIAGPGSAHVIADAPGGALWLGYLGRITHLQNNFWTRFRLDGHVKGLVAGDDGRIWAATRYGLAVHDGKRWLWRRMANSGLPSNDLAGVAVLGTGSPLPPPLAKPQGSLTFRLVSESGSALARARVDLCAAPPGRVMRGGRSPCHGRPLHRISKTDAIGRVSFEKLPPADYYPAILPRDGRHWLIGFSPQRTRVAAGQQADAGTLRLRASGR